MDFIDLNWLYLILSSISLNMYSVVLKKQNMTELQRATKALDIIDFVGITRQWSDV